MEKKVRNENYHIVCFKIGIYKIAAIHVINQDIFESIRRGKNNYSLIFSSLLMMSVLADIRMTRQGAINDSTKRGAVSVSTSF